MQNQNHWEEISAMISHSSKETIEFAQQFAKELKGGEVIGLIGDLGTGKTTFTKGLAEELRVVDIITSPTFVILKPYRGKINDQIIEFIHIDAYRAETIEDIESVGIEDYFGRKDVIIVVEWAEKIREILPKSTTYLNFCHKNEKEREILIKEEKT